MTHETLLRENHIQQDLYQHLETHPLYINLEPYIQSIPSLRSKKLFTNRRTSKRRRYFTPWNGLPPCAPMSQTRASPAVGGSEILRILQ